MKLMKKTHADKTALVRLARLHLLFDKLNCRLVVANRSVQRFLRGIRLGGFTQRRQNVLMGNDYSFECVVVVNPTQQQRFTECQRSARIFKQTPLAQEAEAGVQVEESVFFHVLSHPNLLRNRQVERGQWGRSPGVNRTMVRTSGV